MWEKRALKGHGIGCWYWLNFYHWLNTTHTHTHTRTSNDNRMKNRCLVCKHVQTARVAISTHSDFRYSIRGSFDCDSSNLVYLLECGGCNMQYIGQTDGPFRMRFNNHRYHTKALPNLPLSRHLAMQNHSFDDIKVTLLQSSFSSCREREQCESYLIYKFNTLKGGLNESPGTMTVIRTLHDHWSIVTPGHTRPCSFVVLLLSALPAQGIARSEVYRQPVAPGVRLYIVTPTTYHYVPQSLQLSRPLPTPYQHFPSRPRYFYFYIFSRFLVSTLSKHNMPH